VLTDPLLQWVVALGLALLFAGAAWHKRSAPARFAAQLGAYDLLPQPLVRPAASTLPWLELAAALLLLVPATRPLAALAALALLLAYATGMLVNLLRGRTDIDCGCGGPAQPLSYGLILRNLVLAAGAALLLQPAAGRTVTLADFFLLALLLAPVTLIYAAIGQLFHNAGALRGWSAHES
jgi:hypothetical protein